MQECEQTPGQSVWEHGESVRSYLLDLIRPDHKLEWKLPEWFVERQELIVNGSHPLKVLEEYTLWHDCGKPLCRIVDEDGRAHFPNHADVSQKIYCKVFEDGAVANLIGWDMVLHTGSASEIDDLLKNCWSKADAFSLLLSALSEVHSNARMFGGIDSTSFKIKWKRVCQRGKQILRFYGKLK